MKRFFTFGAGEKFTKAAKRLESQAIKTSMFDEIVTYLDTDLYMMPDFWNVHGDFVEKNPRMYGYGIWKPYLILKELEGMHDGDILFYADSGCEFDLDCENPKDEFDIILEHMKTHKFIATLCNWDKNMNKMDLVLYLDMLEHEGFMSEQIQATTFVMEKNDKIVEFVKVWYDLCSNYSLVNDDPSISNNREYYDEHRHEQSIMSLLLKKRGLYTVPSEVSLESVICLSRNRSEIHFPACRVTGSNFYSLHFGDEFIEGNQIIHMSKMVRKCNPQYILETGFGSGRTAATVIQSCRKKPIIKYVNCDKNYHLYDPISVSYRQYCHDMCPFFESFERRSNELFRGNFLKETFPTGIDWFTVDGDPTYSGCLCELMSVLYHMNPNSIMYVVSDRNKRINFDVRDACDFVAEVFKNKVSFHIDDVVGKEVGYFVCNPLNDQVAIDVSQVDVDPDVDPNPNPDVDPDVEVS